MPTSKLSLETLKQKIKHNRDIADSTLNLYIRNIRLMAPIITGKPFHNIDFIKDYNLVVSKFKEHKVSDSNIKNYCSAILVCLQLNTDHDKELVKKYRKIMFDKNMEYQKTRNQKTDKDTQNWLTQKEMDDTYTKLRKMIIARNLHKPNKKSSPIGHMDAILLTQLLCCSFYTCLPPRRLKDYVMQGISYDEFLKLDEKIRDFNNYAVFKNGSVYFSFGDYKTRKTYGVQINDNLPAKVVYCLKLWRKYYRNTSYLLLNKYLKPMTSASINKLVGRMFEHTGKKVTVTMLRHMYATNNPKLKKYRELKDNAIDTANKMGQSLTQQSEYVKT